MQGFIIEFRAVRDEDLIVTILCEDRIITAYRFYGARHSHINIGFKIDFELEDSYKSDIPRLKDVLSLGFAWSFDRQKLFLWQNFVKLFYNHLKDIDEIESFYFEILTDISKKINKQNPKRAMIEAYVKLLEFEGRLDYSFVCLMCQQFIPDELSLIRGFVATHSRCSYSNSFDKTAISYLFVYKQTIKLEDKDIDRLWNILLLGF
ncbi:MAG: recombination protein RecO [Campylobacteraceae bacterium 4484_166]|nr:MAG: recombination protein RecO [Campylobacteraceae bacterium 4484_166]